MKQTPIKNIKVYLIHGYTGSPESDLFPWIIKQLTKNNIDHEAFHMPDPDFPLVKEWDRYLDINIKRVDENTYFICHSLGCVTLLRYLNRQNSSMKIGGMILVSGFLAKLPQYPMLWDFADVDLDINRIITMVEQRSVFSAPNDMIVNYKYSQDLAELLQAKMITVENGGHFIEQEGFHEFPELFAEFRLMTDKKTIEPLLEVNKSNSK